MDAGLTRTILVLALRVSALFARVPTRAVAGMTTARRLLAAPYAACRRSPMKLRSSA